MPELTFLKDDVVSFDPEFRYEYFPTVASDVIKKLSSPWPKSEIPVDHYFKHPTFRMWAADSLTGCDKCGSRKGCLTLDYSPEKERLGVRCDEHIKRTGMLWVEPYGNSVAIKETSISQMPCKAQTLLNALKAVELQVRSSNTKSALKTK